MRVILAVDIIKGKVVKAFAGLRINYKVLKINGLDYSDPFKLIKKIKEKMMISDVYIADLDAISKLGNNNELIDDILKHFPDVNFLIDSGFDYPISVFYFHKKKQLKKIKNYNLILGTETLKNYNLKSYNLLKQNQISVDFNGKERKWIKKLKKEKTKFFLILMFLKKIGGRGLNLKSIIKYIRVFKKHKVNVAGGLRTSGQLYQLKRSGVEGIISSTFLHSIISRDGK